MSKTIREQAEALAADPLEKIDEVAAELKCSVRFLKDEAKRQRLKIVRLSSQTLRIRRSEKLRYIAECEARGVAA